MRENPTTADGRDIAELCAEFGVAISFPPDPEGLPFEAKVYVPAHGRRAEVFQAKAPFSLPDLRLCVKSAVASIRG